MDSQSAYIQLIVNTWKRLDITLSWIFGLSLKIRSYLVWNYSVAIVYRSVLYLHVWTVLYLLHTYCYSRQEHLQHDEVVKHHLISNTLGFKNCKQSTTNCFKEMHSLANNVAFLQTSGWNWYKLVVKIWSFWALLPLDFSMAIPNTTPESATPAIFSSVRPQCLQRPSPSGSESPPSFHPSLTDRLSLLSTSTSMYETWLLLVAWSSDDVMAVSGWPLWRTLGTLVIIEIQTLPRK